MTFFFSFLFKKKGTITDSVFRSDTIPPPRTGTDTDGELTTPTNNCYPCPICKVQVPVSGINAHLDNCLSLFAENENPDSAESHAAFPANEQQQQQQQVHHLEVSGHVNQQPRKRKCHQAGIDTTGPSEAAAESCKKLKRNKNSNLTQRNKKPRITTLKELWVVQDRQECDDKNKVAAANTESNFSSSMLSSGDPTSYSSCSSSSYLCPVCRSSIPPSRYTNQQMNDHITECLKQDRSGTTVVVDNDRRRPTRENTNVNFEPQHQQQLQNSLSRKVTRRTVDSFFSVARDQK